MVNTANKLIAAVFILSIFSGIAAAQPSIQDVEVSPQEPGTGEQVEITVEAQFSGASTTRVAIDWNERPDTWSQDRSEIYCGELKCTVTWDGTDTEPIKFNEEGTYSFEAQALEGNNIARSQTYEVVVGEGGGDGTALTNLTDVSATKNEVAPGETTTLKAEIENIAEEDVTNEVMIWKADTTSIDQKDVEVPQGETVEVELEKSYSDLSGSIDPSTEHELRGETVQEGEDKHFGETIKLLEDDGDDGEAVCGISSDTVTVRFDNPEMELGEETNATVEVFNEEETQDVTVNLEAGSFSEEDSQTVEKSERPEFKFEVSSDDLQPGENDVRVNVSFGEGPCEGESTVQKESTLTLDHTLDVDFDYEPKEPDQIEDEVEFTESIENDSSIESRSWDFGDGTTSNEENPNHTFEGSGEHNVTLNVTDAEGFEASHMETVDVQPVVEHAFDYSQFTIDKKLIKEGETAEVSLNVKNNGARDQSITVKFKTDDSLQFGRETQDIAGGEEKEFNKTIDSGDIRTEGAVDIYAEISGKEEREGKEDTKETERIGIEILEGPVASFNVSDLNIDEGESIEVFAEQSDSIERYKWNFSGSGWDSTGPNSGYTYRDPGFKQIELLVEGEEGQTDTATKTIAVNKKGAQSPDAGISVSPENPTRGETVTLSGTKTSHPRGEEMTFNWSTGDGNSLSGETVTHSYSRVGTFYPRLKVTDESGNSDYAVADVNVQGLRAQCDVEVGSLEIDDHLVKNGKSHISIEVENDDGDDVRANVRFYRGSNLVYDGERLVEDDEDEKFETTVGSDKDVGLRAEVDVEGDCGSSSFERERSWDVADGLEVLSINHPESVCRGSSFAVSALVRNGRDKAQKTALRSDGLGNIFRGSSFDIESGEKIRQSVTFSNVRNIGERTFSVALQNGGAKTGEIEVKDCAGTGKASDINSFDVTPSQVAVGGSVTASGYLEETGKTNVDIMVDGKTVTTVGSRGDGYFEATIQPNKAGMIQVSASTSSDIKSQSVQMLPTVGLVHMDIPREVRAGQTFEICGEANSQVSPRITLKRDGERIDSQKTEGEFCFEQMEAEPGRHRYRIDVSAFGAHDSESRSVEVLKSGSEVENFPDQIASVRSGSEMVKVELYNTNEETRAYNLRLEDIPEDWVSQTEKEVIVPPNKRETVYFYLTPKKNGQEKANLKVDADGENIYTEEIRLSSRGQKPVKRSLVSRFIQMISL